MVRFYNSSLFFFYSLILLLLQIQLSSQVMRTFGFSILKSRIQVLHDTLYILLSFFSPLIPSFPKTRIFFSFSFSLSSPFFFLFLFLSILFSFFFVFLFSLSPLPTHLPTYLLTYVLASELSNSAPFLSCPIDGADINEY
jgi:hypothetical protein